MDSIPYLRQLVGLLKVDRSSCLHIKSLKNPLSLLLLHRNTKFKVLRTFVFQPLRAYVFDFRHGNHRASA